MKPKEKFLVELIHYLDQFSAEDGFNTPTNEFINNLYYKSPEVARIFIPYAWKELKKINKYMDEFMLSFCLIEGKDVNDWLYNIIEEALYVENIVVQDAAAQLLECFDTFRARTILRYLKLKKKDHSSEEYIEAIKSAIEYQYDDRWGMNLSENILNSLVLLQIEGAIKLVENSFHLVYKIAYDLVIDEIAYFKNKELDKIEINQYARLEGDLLAKLKKDIDNIKKDTRKRLYYGFLG